MGKTWLVRDLAARHNLTHIELNFERNPSLAALFNTNDPRETPLNLESEFNTPIHPKPTLLFLDEIQAAPETSFPCAGRSVPNFYTARWSFN